ncbi:OB fold domain-containing protein [Aspergillus affinis]|uniref:OB fold domain-containing protein n=1 Tax=Aspergillus affinis TaxID=1070780 RepID=UPI0022FF3136|nr:DUF1767-domain-containing protein [Aspergillus affinis]KAI9045533.1 DUF1767-domain-containing protein [Aspergillus affinis]
MANINQQISAQLQGKSLPVSSSWLNTFVASTSHQRNVPLAALTQTAVFRVLASDFRDSLTTSSPSSLLPAEISDPTVQERRIQGPIPVQVLDIEDIGSSLWSQVEAIERVERGEAIRGREIVRTVNVGEDRGEGVDSANGTAGSNELGNNNGPHRLIVQDAKGTKAVAVELRQVHGIGIGKLAIGAKLLLRNVTVARGMMLLTPECVTILGGKIDAMDLSWRDGRKERLLARITAAAGEQTQ